MAAKSDLNEIYISSSPHFHSGHSTKKIMLSVIISLLPLCVWGVITFGIPALITILTSVVSCVIFELFIQKVTKRPVRVSDCSAIVTGIMLALVLPPTTPIWITMLGAFFAIVVAKELFGGIGANVFNPALTGRAFLFVSFPVVLGSQWLDPATDAISGATMLSSMKAGTAVADSDLYLQYFLGSRAGCIGETSILLILIAFVFLVVTKIIDWRAPVAMVATVAVATAIAGGDVLLSLLTGGLLFGAVFMVTDYATSPVTPVGRLIFGFGCGLITFLIRQFGGYPEGVMFSILIMNSVVPFLNKIVGRKYGYKLQKKGAKK